MSRGAFEPINDFGELRSLAQRGPQGWSQLSLSLERWYDKESLEQLVLPYLRAHLKTWPRGSVAAPRRWKKWAMLGHEVPGLKLFDALSFRHMRLDPGPYLSPARRCVFRMWELECLQHLTYLDLTRSSLSPCDLTKEILSRPERFTALRALEIHNGNQLPDFISDRYKPLDTLRAEQLELLGVRRCELDPERFEQLVLSPDRLQALRMLKVSHNPLGDDGVRLIAQAPQLSGLTSIDLRGVGMTHLGLRALARALFLKNLVWLSLSLENGDASAQKRVLLKLLSNPALGNLGALTLVAPWLDDIVVEQIASSPHFANLNTLNLVASNLPVERSALAPIERFKALGLPKLSVDGARAIVRSPYLSDPVRRAWLPLLEDH